MFCEMTWNGCFFLWMCRSLKFISALREAGKAGVPAETWCLGDLKDQFDPLYMWGSSSPAVPFVPCLKIFLPVLATPPVWWENLGSMVSNSVWVWCFSCNLGVFWHSGTSPIGASQSNGRLPENRWPVSLVSRGGNHGHERLHGSTGLQFAMNNGRSTIIARISIENELSCDHWTVTINHQWPSLTIVGD